MGFLYGGDLDWTTSGTDIYRATGKVGIGTASPRTTLHVATTESADQNVFRLEEAFGSGNPTQFVFELADTGISGLATKNMVIRGLSSTSDLAFSPSSDSPGALVIKDGGNVGIGVGDPDHPLEIYKDSAQMKLSYDASTSCVFNLQSNGNLSIVPTGTEVSITGDFRIYDANDQSETIARIYDSSDDGLISGFANNIETVKIHANGDSYFSGGSLVVGGTSADASSCVDLISTAKGFLPPRMTTTQRNAIGSPAAGLTIYNSTTNVLNFYDGSSWQATSGGGGGNDFAVTAKKSVNYTASNWDCVLVDLVAAATSFIVTLPAASANAQIAIKIVGLASGKTVTIDGDSAETIDGSATQIMNTDHESMLLISDGTTWMRL